MKLVNVEYKNSDNWYGCEYLPDNPRSIILYTLEGGEAEGKYENNKWIQYRWGCEVHPISWREMPRYYVSGQSSLR